jgi:hypothetical protein
VAFAFAASWARAGWKASTDKAPTIASGIDFIFNFIGVFSCYRGFRLVCFSNDLPRSRPAVHLHGARASPNILNKAGLSSASDHV